MGTTLLCHDYFHDGKLSWVALSVKSAGQRQHPTFGQRFLQWDCLEVSKDNKYGIYTVPDGVEVPGRLTKAQVGPSFKHSSFAALNAATKPKPDHLSPFHPNPTFHLISTNLGDQTLPCFRPSTLSCLDFSWLSFLDPSARAAAISHQTIWETTADDP
ncbi:hypothetical protein SODALDRAFT_358096 [Sodiomyces alkalinus F11]|uniref:Uncharacterized protein n=1 Tax=Sodiomyces alkalinus (strain CBS 110278 / VKM F-3762 / F11) TaxID=1314773 RepID=A0A3N2PZ33_SODAK|nr:hypothetical protein SODALDRAFT_358096 [Sodiomyces alkalinus F11]ROT39686.1 hypothetical protein SODALDRAFT_358096 [Sodiomyces alkalinus F11]